MGIRSKLWQKYSGLASAFGERCRNLPFAWDKAEKQQPEAPALEFFPQVGRQHIILINFNRM